MSNANPAEQMRAWIKLMESAADANCSADGTCEFQPGDKVTVSGEYAPGLRGHVGTIVRQSIKTTHDRKKEYWIVDFGTNGGQFKIHQHYLRPER